MKKTIKLSKSQWEYIGKQAGWIRVSQFEADIDALVHWAQNIWYGYGPEQMNSKDFIISEIAQILPPVQAEKFADEWLRLADSDRSSLDIKGWIRNTLESEGAVGFMPERGAEEMPKEWEPPVAISPEGESLGPDKVNQMSKRDFMDQALDRYNNKEITEEQLKSRLLEFAKANGMKLFKTAKGYKMKLIRIASGKLPLSE